MEKILKPLFELRGELSKKVTVVSQVVGAVIFFGVWTVITEFGLVPKGILPSPLKIVASFAELHFNDALVRNASYSFQLNAFGLAEAVLVALPLGFVIGLFPVFKNSLAPVLSAIRFTPLSAVVSLFIAWFGIGTNMKVQFLAFSIFLYLLPVVVQRVNEVENIYDQTVRTLGASTWQRIRYVFIPAVNAAVFNDIRVLAALSWTYIIIAELVNTAGGGIGALSYIAARQSRTDKVFAILMTIMVIGYLQDKILLWLDKQVFPHKYAIKKVRG